MTHIHWVARQNKLEPPKEKDEVNKREVHECDGRGRDPDAMVAPPTPKPTRKAKALARAPPSTASSCEENYALVRMNSGGSVVYPEAREAELAKFRL